jgi:diguanylate cyclase (GGDEF)-like protein
MDRKDTQCNAMAARRRDDVLTPAEEPAFDHLVELTRLALSAPIAGISIHDGRPYGGSRAARGSGLRERPLHQAAFAREELLVVEDASADPRFRDDPSVAEAPGVRAYIAAPIVVDGRTVGTICAADTRPRHFGDNARNLIANLADCAAREMALHRRAAHDDLTGFLTRNAFFAQLRSAHEAHRSTGQEATLAFLDLDHFKALNDRFGHHAGDRALCAVARACREHLGPEAVLGRIGGEEFGILLPQEGMNRALQRLERLRVTIASLKFADEPALRITGSFGVCAVQRSVASVPVWCKMADAALYGAKHAGRNMIIVFKDALGLPAGGPLPFPRLNHGGGPSAAIRTMPGQANVAAARA